MWPAVFILLVTASWVYNRGESSEWSQKGHHSPLFVPAQSCLQAINSWVCLCHACLSSPRMQSTLFNVREAWESCLGRDRKGHPSLPWLLSSMTDTLWLSVTGQSQGPQGSFPEIQISTQQTSVCASKDYDSTWPFKITQSTWRKQPSLLNNFSKNTCKTIWMHKRNEKTLFKIYSYRSSVPSKA